LEIFKRSQAGSYRRKEFKFASGRVQIVQGYEPFCLQELLNSNVTEEEIIRGFELMTSVPYEFNGKKHRYMPDIFLPPRRLIEVKSSYTLRVMPEVNMAKINAAALQGFDAELRVYSPKGVLEQLVYPTVTPGVEVIHVSYLNGISTASNVQISLFPPFVSEVIKSYLASQFSPSGATVWCHHVT